MFPFLKVKPRILYLLFSILMAVVFLLFYYRYKMHTDTIKNGKEITVVIKKVACSGYKESSNYIVFNYEGENHIVNVGKEECYKYKSGDSTSVKYNEKYNLYSPPTKVDTSNDFWGMCFGGTFFLIGIFYLIRTFKL